MPFQQRLPVSFYRSVQDGLRERMAGQGLSAVLADHPEDVAYLTGFFHHPCERPVAVVVEATGTKP